MTDDRSTRAGLSERAHHAGEDKPAVPRQRRMSAKKKQEAVLRVRRRMSFTTFSAAGFCVLVPKSNPMSLGADGGQSRPIRNRMLPPQYIR